MVTNRDSVFAKQSVPPKANRPESTELGPSTSGN